ncbi:TylF/MycF family methyltransferase [Bosea sp. NBC_00550]|uniref:TylF/MycF family methyltransferase n=1 Tax=Bosea sp. NBC_00550 TaxID=2969621 RepID=UPI0022305148|nr:TylF/MycF family methyltransferase [Bosea sp. NBC_00550]UZF91287.1 TylF/MycF family methyltransferase [Bosea sp. NBC_00550]
MDDKLKNSRDMYIDLMIRILANTIYEDTSIHPYFPKDYDPDKRQTGLDWPKTAHTMVGVERLKNLADLASRALESEIPGDFIETGVWRGGCCILMRSILGLYSDKQRRVFVADSFEGLPLPKPDVYKADIDDPHHTYAELAISLEEVKSNFSRYNLLDDQVVFVKGFFEDTLQKLTENTFALLRLDGDMYESTYCALEELYPQLSPGGYIIIDDFGAIDGCRQAVEEYRRIHDITAPMTEVDWTGVWWQKPTA